MGESARYDVADDDSMANGSMEDESERSSALPKVPKLFLSNNCIFNCAYCGCRSSNDLKRRYVHSPREMAEMAVLTAKRTGTGVFITSAIHKNPDYTVELIVETLRILRFEMNFWQYIHAKIMPGTDPLLIEEAGWLADRLSVNIEIPNSAGYPMIAAQKSRETIIRPITEISDRIQWNKYRRNQYGRLFAKSGQSTQVMVGTMDETDRILLTLAQALYRKYRLRRVYYSPFSPAQPHYYLPSNPTPKWRTRRLYQADRLIELYGFDANELATEEMPNMAYDLDPKAMWALRHMDMYPVELNNADYETLIRIPGIGLANAQKIIDARRYGMITHQVLKSMHVSLKRAQYFITCSGKFQGGNALDSLELAAEKLRDREDIQMEIMHETPSDPQLCCI